MYASLSVCKVRSEFLTRRPVARVVTAERQLQEEAEYRANEIEAIYETLQADHASRGVEEDEGMAYALYTASQEVLSRAHRQVLTRRDQCAAEQSAAMEVNPTELGDAPPVSTSGVEDPSFQPAAMDVEAAAATVPPEAADPDAELDEMDSDLLHHLEAIVAHLKASEDPKKATAEVLAHIGPASAIEDVFVDEVNRLLRV